MPSLRTIGVDFDVHRCIENERRSFDESPNYALRRLLGLGEPRIDAPKEQEPDARHGKSWADKGVVLPHGTPVRMTYNDRIYEGQIVEGRWVIDGREFDSPSGAASGIARTKKGGTTRLDGWIYWEVRLPGENQWSRLEALRQNRPAISLTDLF